MAERNAGTSPEKWFCWRKRLRRAAQAARSAGRVPEREFTRRLSVWRFLSAGNTPAGSSPESATAGRWSSTTLALATSHWTPGQAHGEGAVAFQRRVRPRTAERRASSAARSDEMSENVEGKKKAKKIMVKVAKRV